MSSVLTEEDIEVLKVHDGGCMGGYTGPDGLGGHGCTNHCEYLDLCKRLAGGDGATLELIAYFEEKLAQ